MKEDWKKIRKKQKQGKKKEQASASISVRARWPSAKPARGDCLPACLLDDCLTD